jgi:hypothetical protein
MKINPMNNPMKMKMKETRYEVSKETECEVLLEVLERYFPGILSSDKEALNALLEALSRLEKGNCDSFVAFSPKNPQKGLKFWKHGDSVAMAKVVRLTNPVKQMNFSGPQGLIN